MYPSRSEPKTEERLKLLSDTAAQLLLHEDPKDLLEDVFRRTSSHLDLEVYFNFLTCEEAEHLTLASCAGVPEEVLPGLQRLELGQAVCGTVAAERKWMMVEDVQASREGVTDLIRSLGIAAYVCHPLIARGELLGTLSFGTRRRSRFAPDDLELLRALSDQIAAALERARLIAELRRANAAKDRFLATLSHELRTPLTPVLAMVSCLEADERLRRQRGGQLAVIRRNVELEARLIDDLLDLTRISRGKIEMVCAATDLREVLEHALQACGPQEGLDAKGLRIEARFDAPDHTVWGDACRLTQVFWNLLKNAVKFTPEAGVIRISSRREALAGGEGLAIEVADTGIGIEPDLLPRIFDAFEQGERSITRRFGGLGLGLAISKTIVELHGGWLTAASDGPGRGATFTVHLPLAHAGVRPCRSARGSGAEKGTAAGGDRPLRILLVEDHADTAAAIADLLGLRGHRVTVARDVASGLAAAQAAMACGGIDLVISDLGLPDGSGHDLMRELSRCYGLHGIALSGYGTEEDVHRSREAGFVVHVTKPVDFRTLQAAVRRAVAGNR